MNARRFAAWTILIILSVPAIAAEPRPADFGKQWVRSHPFTITALIQRKEAVRDRMYVDAGLNTMLTWKDRPELYQWAISQGIPWHYHVNKREGALTEELKAEFAAMLQANPGCEGVIVCDEPKLTEMPAAAEIMDWVKQQYPQLLVYTNAYPMVWTNESMAKLAGGEWIASGVYDEPPVPYSYSEYLDDIIRIMKPDVLVMDQYPFVQPPEGDPAVYYQERYFESLAAVRKTSLRSDVPFWLFVQAYAGAGGSRRLPSESDVRMQVYSSLGFGCTGVAYFTYDAVESGSMLNDDFSPSRIFSDIAELNKELAHIGKPLRFLTSTDVRYVPGKPVGLKMGRVVGVPRGIGLFSFKSRVAKQVQDITISQAGDGRDAMIGFFKDDAGGDYFMLVNLLHGGNKTAEQAAMSIKIKLAPEIKSLHRISRMTGQVESVDIVNGEVEVTLPGGTGDLFKIGDGNFPGM